MKVKEYLIKIGIKEYDTKQMCFVIGEVFKENSIGNKVIYYRNSQLLLVSEWYKINKEAVLDKDKILDYNVLNIQQPVINWMSGVNWNHLVESDSIISLLIMSDEELQKCYYEDQIKDIIRFIDSRIENCISKNI